MLLSNSHDVMQAIQVLRCKDKILSGLFDLITIEPLFPRHLNFSAMVKLFTQQQLSGKAASTIFSRLEALCEGLIIPETIAGHSDMELRKCGLSSGKIGYIRALIIMLEKKPDLLESLTDMTSEESFKSLIKIKGIGKWSASIILLFYFCHMDIFPLGDATLNRAIEFLYHKNPDFIPELITAWSPYNSVVSLALWQWIDQGFSSQI
jgi:3-methyladenine DNA glycosylase/8-oxoguanine DNA glycosylase